MVLANLSRPTPHPHQKSFPQGGNQIHETGWRFEADFQVNKIFFSGPGGYCAHRATAWPAGLYQSGVHCRQRVVAQGLPAAPFWHLIQQHVTLHPRFFASLHAPAHGMQPGPRLAAPGPSSVPRGMFFNRTKGSAIIWLNPFVPPSHATAFDTLACTILPPAPMV